MREPINLGGKRFGRLLVVSLKEIRGFSPYWNCVCDCGCQTIIVAYDLTRGHTKSCGCLGREASAIRRTIHGATKHGKSTHEYIVWASMKARCYQRNSFGYKWYGAKGIRICRRWFNSFTNFLADMGPRPEGHQLDRIDTNGDYKPKNCRWATPKQQSRNRTNNHILKFRKQEYCIAEWAEKTGLTRNAIFYRLKLGWSIEKTLTHPLRITHQPKRSNP